MIKDYAQYTDANGETHTVLRVTKRIAKNMYAKGYNLFLQSVNMFFNSTWQSAYLIDGNQGRGFDSIVNDFEYYNTDSDRGQYAKFYVFSDDLKEYKRRQDNKKVILFDLFEFANILKEFDNCLASCCEIDTNTALYTLQNKLTKEQRYKLVARLKNTERDANINYYRYVTKITCNTIKVKEV